MTNREKQIREIARQNARNAVDQGAVEGYHDNMIDTLAEHFTDLTIAELNIVERLFARITKSADFAAHKVEGSQAEFDRYIAGDR